MKKILLFTLFIFSVQNLSAQYISVQGVLRDNNNRAVPDKVEGYDMIFTLYSAESGGDILWGPTQKNGIDVLNGVYSIDLDIGTNIQNGTSELWMQVSVDGETMGQRIRLHLSPYEHYITTGGTNYVPESGNVGIGTTTPTAKLDVMGNAKINSVLSVSKHSEIEGYNSTGESIKVGELNFGHDIWGPAIWSENPDGFYSDYLHLHFGTPNHDGNSTVNYESDMMINGFSGYVGIGTTNPNAKLHVAGPLNIDNRFKFYSESGSGRMKITGDNALPHWYIYGDYDGQGTGNGTPSDFKIVLKKPDGTHSLWLNSDGLIHATEIIDSDHGNYNLNPYGTSKLATLNVEIFNDVLSFISDNNDRIQYSNVENINTGILDKFSALQPVSFTAEIDGNKVNSFGFRDENLREISPELIRESESITREDGSATSSSTGLDVFSLVVQSVGAINELKTEKDAEIEALNQAIEDLVKRIEELENR